MRSVVAALMLAAASAASAQSNESIATAVPGAGSWSYGPAQDGSEAVFVSASGYQQLWMHCSRATRQMSIARVASAAAPLMTVWTSSMSRAVAATFAPASARLTVSLGNYDPLLDAIATSRGRIGFAVGSEAPLVVPAWPEVARVIEDCRA